MFDVDGRLWRLGGYRSFLEVGEWLSLRRNLKASGIYL